MNESIVPVNGSWVCGMIVGDLGEDLVWGGGVHGQIIPLVTEFGNRIALGAYRLFGSPP